MYFELAAKEQGVQRRAALSAYFLLKFFEDILLGDR